MGIEIKQAYESSSDSDDFRILYVREGAVTLVYSSKE